MRHYLLLIAFCVALLSCKKDKNSDDNQLAQTCTNCTYLPVCDKSQYVYVHTTAAGTDTIRNQVSILGDTTVNGKKFTKVSALATFDQGFLYNCDNQEYKVLLSWASLGINPDSLKRVIIQMVQLPISPSLILMPNPLTLTVLKANADVNAKWTDTLMTVNLPPFFTASAGLQHTLVEKNITRTVLQKTYTNVYHVQSRTVSNLPSGSLPINLSFDFYFSKDVGIIEMEQRDGQTLVESTKLFSYKK